MQEIELARHKLEVLREEKGDAEVSTVYSVQYHFLYTMYSIYFTVYISFSSSPLLQLPVYVTLPQLFMLITV